MNFRDTLEDDFLKAANGDFSEEDKPKPGDLLRKIDRYLADDIPECEDKQNLRKACTDAIIHLVTDHVDNLPPNNTISVVDTAANAFDNIKITKNDDYMELIYEPNNEKVCLHNKLVEKIKNSIDDTRFHIGQDVFQFRNVPKYCYKFGMLGRVTTYRKLTTLKRPKNAYVCTFEQQLFCPSCDDKGNDIIYECCDDVNKPCQGCSMEVIRVAKECGCVTIN